VDWYLIILRALHILAGVAWVGSFYLFFLFIQPAVQELGPSGQAFVTHLTERKKLPMAISAAAILTLVAGILLYIRDSDGFDLDWITSGPGLGFTIGGIAAILAFAFGFLLVRPAVDRMAAMGQQMAAAGAPPSSDQIAEMQRLGSRAVAVGWVIMALLTIAVIAMAVARFL
jgi:uncharacterized membrane protein